MFLEPLERHPARTFAAIGLVFAVVYVAALTVFPRSQGRVVNGDAIQYYAYLRSLAIDRDLDFTNDYELLYAPEAGDEGSNVWLTSRTPIGRPTNLMSIGPALLWAPFFLITYVALLIAGPFGLSIPLDGMATPFPLSAGVAGVFYATLGAYFCYRACRELFPDGPSFWAAIVAWLATPVVYYSLVSPLYSHAVSFFATALFTYVWLATRRDSVVRRFVVLGGLAGLCALVRWQDLIVLLFPIVELGYGIARRRLGIFPAAGRVAVMAGVAAVVFAPQLVAWRAIYGQFMLLPQGEGFMRWTSPALGSVFFSLNHGLFTWTPAVLVAACGLALVVRRDSVTGWAAVAMLLIAAYINASVSDWWAGEAFGARRFIGYTVTFALGFSAFFTWAVTVAKPAWLRAAAAGLVVYNLLFLLQYQLFMRGFRELVPYPTTIQQVFFDRLLLPFELLRAWLSSPGNL